MMSDLAVSWEAGGELKGDNVMLPWETVTIRLTNLPQKATNVQVKVLENVDDVAYRDPVRHRLLVGFVGEIKNGNFDVHQRFGPDYHHIPDPLTIQIKLANAIEGKSIFGFSADTARIRRHVLVLHVEGVVDGRKVSFHGRHELRIKQPLAMVVPAERRWRYEDLFDFHVPYAKNWQRYDPSVRHVEMVQAVVTKDIPKRKIQPSHYDDWIRAIASAAKKADVVAVCTGHGAMNSSIINLGNADADPTDSYVNLVPEDNKKKETGVTFKLGVSANELEPYDASDRMLKKQSYRNMITHAERVKLDALDRLADALQGTNVRRILFHTCRVGGDGNFMQLLANRIRVPVMAQKDYVMFAGTTPPSSFYKKDKRPDEPRDQHYWPMHRCSKPYYPRDEEPKRYGPP